MNYTANRLAYGQIARRRLFAVYAVGILIGCIAAAAALLAMGTSIG
jgi:hypothetical protein